MNKGSSSDWAFVTNDSVNKTSRSNNFYGFSYPSGGN
jgi:hypothetical protein